MRAANGKVLKPDNVPVSLLLPMGKDGPAFLAYHNFTTTYLKWNESLVYSTTAAYLAHAYCWRTTRKSRASGSCFT